MKKAHWILGPGAIGRLLAHSLKPRGEVTLIGRRQLHTHQTLRTAEGKLRTQSLMSFTAARLALEPLAAPDYLHITTKAMAAEAALDSVAPFLPHSTPLVLWQNGFLSQSQLTQTWPGPVLCASTTEGAYLAGEDDLVHAGRGHTFIGDLNKYHAALAQTLASLLTRAGLATTPVSNIHHRLWQKLAVNAAINPLAALNGVHNGELAQPPYVQRVEAVVREVAAIMEAEGIEPSGGDGGAQEWRSLVAGVMKSTANNKASMLQDIEAGRPTERKAILGPLIECARGHGLPCETLVALDQALAALEARF